MGKIGTWSYWFKTEDGKDVINSTNKLDIPIGYEYVVLFKVHKPNGDIDEELSLNNKLICKHKNINKLSPCDKFHTSMKTFEKIYELLNVKYPKNKYKVILNKKIKLNPDLKNCKIN